jgi:predicted nucleic acid-binding protein
VSGSSVVVDTNVFVTARNPDEGEYVACRRLLDRVDSGRLRALISTVTVAEVRAGLGLPEAQEVWQAILSHFLTSPNYSVEPVDVAIAERASELRQRAKLTLPEAIIVATGLLRGATAVVPQDRQFGRRTA